ncbi:hypothetical protein ACFQUU_27110 [Herbaspirillum sp. GCM10030257]|uniref:hypothetical protein n=1 Tax=Herbaspirillum sp. GCM10030257 TaxID=3273393 RepID=UPI0036185C63
MGNQNTPQPISALTAAQYIRVDRATLAADRTPVPDFLYGLLPESLVDLTWSDPALGVHPYAWLPYEDVLRDDINSATHIATQEGETFAVNLPVGVVRVTPGVRSLTEGEQEERRQRVAKELTDAKAAKLREANRECDIRINALTSTYPATEVLTFSKQEMEARAFLVDELAPTPMIDALAMNRNVPKLELVARIIGKADAFAGFTGAVVGYRQLLEDRIDAATSMSVLSEIDPLAGWPV